MNSMDRSGISMDVSLTQAVIWCSMKANPSNPKDSLRSTEIRPDWFDRLSGFVGQVVKFRAEQVRYEHVWDKARLFAESNSFDAAKALAARLVRGTEYQGETLPLSSREDLLDGRLLIYRPDENLCDGAAESETRGFFDVDNIPPWDTWVGFYPNESDQIARDLICYIPKVFVPLAQRGIDVNPEACINWLDTANTPEAELLRARGFIGYEKPYVTYRGRNK